MIKGSFFLFLFLILINNFPFWKTLASDCPRGLVNDPAPGECGLYVDKNKDGICDHSQELAQIEEKTPAGSNTITTIPKNFLSTENDLSQSNRKEGKKDINSEEDGDSVKKKKESNFYFWPITLVISFSYFLSWFFTKVGWLSCFANRFFWNWLLLLFFILTLISSLVLLGRLEFGWEARGANWSFWHIEFGYIMLLISFFHFSWHGRYYFRKRKKEECF